jgi:hypothetical protein
VELCVDGIAEYRLRRVLRATDLRKAKSPRLYLRAPDLLVAAWWAGGEWRDAAASVVAAASRTDLDRVLKLLDDGKLPREIAAAGCGDARLSLGTLARLLPAGGADFAAWAPALVRGITQAPPTSPEADLRALAVLAGSPVNDVAYAAAGRAVLLGEPARELSRALLARQALDADLRTATAALRLAVEHGIELPALPDLLARLRPATEWDVRVVADAAELRFGALDPGACKYPGESIAMAGIDVDKDALRKVLGAHAAWRLSCLLPACSPATCVNGLRLAGELPFWDEALEGVILGKTNDAEPRVRRAAYEALHTRDADLWPCAWLVHEAVFDPDSLVREFAQQLGR